MRYELECSCDQIMWISNCFSDLIIYSSFFQRKVFRPSIYNLRLYLCHFIPKIELSLKRTRTRYNINVLILIFHCLCLEKLTWAYFLMIVLNLKIQSQVKCEIQSLL